MHTLQLLLVLVKFQNENCAAIHVPDHYRTMGYMAPHGTSYIMLMVLVVRGTVVYAERIIEQRYSIFFISTRYHQEGCQRNPLYD